jgi:CheY-like chemotaxis protein
MLNVLLIDDNVLFQITFRKILSVAGYAVQLASNGDKGLRMALNNAPDIIVLNMLLPKLGGIEVLRALKQYAGTRHIPVIALNGLPRSNQAKLIREGAVSHLENSEALLQAIDNALLLHRQDKFCQEPKHPKGTRLEEPTK